MRCAEFESRLNDVLDERLWLDADPALGEHVQSCAPCRALAASYEAVITGLEQSRIPQTSSALTDRILSSIPTSQADSAAPAVIRGPFGQSSSATPGSNHKRREARRRPMLIGSAVAAAAVAAIAVLWNSSNLENDLAPPVRNGQATIAAARNATPSEAPLAAAPLANGSPAADMATDASDSVAIAMRLFPGVGAMADESTDGEGDAQASQWMHGVSDGLKPVTSTTASAVSSFFELLAGGDEGSRS